MQLLSFFWGIIPYSGIFRPFGRTGCDYEQLNPIADIGGIRGLVPTCSPDPQFAVGSIISSSGYYTTKDGKRHKTKPQYKFQSRGRRGVRTLRDEAADAARRREPAVGQEAVSSRSRMRRPVRSQWLTQRHDRLNTACCLSAKGVAKTKQRFDRAVGPAAAHCRQNASAISAIFQRNKSHP